MNLPLAAPPRPDARPLREPSGKRAWPAALGALGAAQLGLAVCLGLRLALSPFAAAVGQPDALWRPRGIGLLFASPPPLALVVSLQVLGVAAAAVFVWRRRLPPLVVAWVCLLLLAALRTSLGKILHNDVLLLLAAPPLLLAGSVRPDEPKGHRRPAGSPEELGGHRRLAASSEELEGLRPAGSSEDLESHVRPAGPSEELRGRGRPAGSSEELAGSIPTGLATLRSSRLASGLLAPLRRREAGAGSLAEEAARTGLDCAAAIVLLSYLCTAWWKLLHTGPAWALSDNLRWALAAGRGGSNWAALTDWLVGHPAACVALACAILGLELGSALVWLRPRLAPAFAAAAALLHAGTWLVLGLDYWAHLAAVALVLLPWARMRSR